jgi:hypothetical protein
MKILLFILISISYSVFSQINLNDYKRIKIASIILPQSNNTTVEAQSALINKMNQIITSNGLSSELNTTRFIITPNINILNKEILSGSPILYSLKMEITFYIGDAVSGTKFSSAPISVIGIGQSETKAYIQAINKINYNDVSINKALEIGKNKIVEYYTTNCDLIIREAVSKSYTRNFDESIYDLISIPDVCNECYNKALDAITPIYKQKIDYECSINLNKANNIWNSNLSYNGANEAGNYLSKIDPQSSCYTEAKELRNKINNKINEIDKRNWDFKWESEIGLTKDLIKTYRDIGVAWGENQPKTINYSSTNIIWW